MAQPNAAAMALLRLHHAQGGRHTEHAADGGFGGVAERDLERVVLRWCCFGGRVCGGHGGVGGGVERRADFCCEVDS